MKKQKPFIHQKAIVEPGAMIGAGTRVWAFAHVLPGAKIGRDCNVCDGVFVENDVVIGDRVTVKCGVQVWDGITLEDDVFVGPNATFTNDPFPRSKQYPEEFPKTVVHRGASIGANATILPGLSIGAHAMVGAGAVVTRDVPTNAIVVGNPARIKGYVNTILKGESSAKSMPYGDHNMISPKVRDVKIIRLPEYADLRGKVAVAEYEKALPFIPRRCFFIYDVMSKETRGEHAHKTLEEVVICVSGSCSFVLDDGINREEYVLNRPDIGLYLPPMVWRTHYKYTEDAVCVVFASDEYNPEDYIRDYDTYISQITNS